MQSPIISLDRFLDLMAKSIFVPRDPEPKLFTNDDFSCLATSGSLGFGCYHHEKSVRGRLLEVIGHTSDISCSLASYPHISIAVLFVPKVSLALILQHY